MTTGFALLTSLFLITWFNGVKSNNLYLQPAESERAYVTNESFFVACHSSGDSQNQLKWEYQQNVLIPRSGRIYVQPNDDPNSPGLLLVVSQVEMDDAGTYACSDFKSTISFELTVLKAISFGNTPPNQHAREGEDAEIVCHVNNDRVLVQWYFQNGSLINVETDKHKQNSNNGLIIYNVSRKDAGIYRCNALLATTNVARNKKVDISFHVQHMPEFVDDTESVVYTSIGTLTNLSCTVLADPAPKFRWMRNGDTIHNSSDFMILNNDTRSVLQFTVNEESQFGEYLCRAENVVGTVEKTITLEIGDAPEPPKLTVVSEDKGTLTVELHSPVDEDNRLPVTGFKVEYTLTSGTWDQAMSEEFKKGDSYVLNNVSYNTEYSLRATARNAAGYGDFSEVVTYMTQPLQVAPVVADKAITIATSMIVMILGACILWVFY